METTSAASVRCLVEHVPYKSPPLANDSEKMDIDVLVVLPAVHTFISVQVFLILLQEHLTDIWDVIWKRRPVVYWTRYGQPATCKVSVRCGIKGSKVTEDNSSRKWLKSLWIIVAIGNILLSTEGPKLAVSPLCKALVGERPRLV